MTEQFLKSVLAQDPVCRYLVIANEDNPPFAEGDDATRGPCDCDEDSLAMISEAVGAGKK